MKNRVLICILRVKMYFGMHLARHTRIIEKRFLAVNYDGKWSRKGKHAQKKLVFRMVKMAFSS